MLILLSLILLITVTYWTIEYRYNYWRRKNVPGPRPNFPFGNIGRALLMKTSAGKIYTDIYKKYENEGLVGLYRTTTPVLMVRDPELIKEVVVKSFSHFEDNDFYADKKYDPIFGRNVFVLKGDEWRLVRGQITPGFSSGKIKSVHFILEASSEKLIRYIDDKSTTANGQVYDVKELATRLMLENVANVAFGLEGRCFDEENSEFRQLARDFLSPGSWTYFVFPLLVLIPSLATRLRLRFITKNVENKLMDVINRTVKYRDENNINRNDFLNVIIQLKKTCKQYEFTNVDVVAQSAAFFIDGYETSSLVMSFALFEVAKNPEIQSKLREETDKVFDGNGGKAPYEAIQTMPYLEGVVKETMRVHTPVFHAQKLCTRTFTFPSKSTPAVTVERGTPIIIPLHGLHHDKKHHEDPELFKPERFIGENKENLTKFTYMPFGEGPRACIGIKYGMSQIKVGIAYVIRHYELSVNEKTKLPLEYDPVSSLTSAVGGLWLDFKKIR